MGTAFFAQLATLMSSIVLLFGITLLWRRSLHAYIDAFRWQSVVLTVLFVLIGYYSDDPELYFVAVFFFILKVIILPIYLHRLQKQVGAEGEIQPYVNVATSLILAGLLVLLAYAVTRPLVTRKHTTDAWRSAAGDGADLCWPVCRRDA